MRKNNTKIVNPDAYFNATVRNMDKNDFRANDRYYEHVSSVGGIAELESAWRKNKTQMFSTNDDEIKSPQTADEWLDKLNDPLLHQALSKMCTADLDLLFKLFVIGLTMREVANLRNVSHVSIHKQFKRISEQIVNIIRNG